MDQSQAQDLDLQRLIRVIRRAGGPVLLGALLLAGATFLVSRAQPPQYRAGATLGALPTGSSNAELNASLSGAPALPPQVFAEALRSPQVSAFALQRLQRQLSSEAFGPLSAALSTPEGFGETVTLQADVDQQQVGVYVLSAQAPRAETARRVADAYAAGLLEWDRRRARQNIERALTTVQARGNALSRQIAEAQLGAGQTGVTATPAAARAALAQQISQLVVLSETVTGTLVALTPATSPPDPVSPRPLRDAALVFGAALFFGFLLAAVLDYARRTSLLTRVPMDALPPEAGQTLERRGGVRTVAEADVETHPS